MPLARTLVIRLLPSFLKKRYYQWRGAKIGHGVTFGWFSVIDADLIEIGNHSHIGMFVRISARKFKMGSYSSIGNDTKIAAAVIKIGNETMIQEQVVIGGMQSRKSRIEIGDRCSIFPYCFINPTRPIKIGNDVGIGGANYLFTHGTWTNMLEGFPGAFGPITIEDRVWLPWRVFVLPNVTIGHDSVIAAGSVISRSIPPRSLAAGVPAQVKKTGDDFVPPRSKAQKIEFLKEMFEEFQDFLYLKGYRLKSSLDENLGENIWQGFIETKTGNTMGCVIVSESFSDEIVNRLDSKLYYVSMNKGNEEIKRSIEKKRGSWFELEEYVWNGNRDALTSTLRSFFSTFGVRFKSLDLENE